VILTLVSILSRICCRCVDVLDGILDAAEVAIFGRSASALLNRARYIPKTLVLDIITGSVGLGVVFEALHLRAPSVGDGLMIA